MVKRVLVKAGELLIYFIMLVCVVIFFTGHGTFIYEGF